MTFRTPKASRSIDAALRPDNIKIPEGMKLSQRRRDNEISFHVSVSLDSQNSLETLISTLDEFVKHIQSATETIEETSSKERK